MDLYLSKQLAVPMKVRVLQSIKSLLKFAGSKYMGPSTGKDHTNLKHHICEFIVDTCYVGSILRWQSR
jgi:hypothetical protein